MVDTAALFDLVLSGHLSQGVDPASAQAQLAQLFKMPVEKVDALLASAPVTLKRELSWEAAKRYRAAIKQAGALSDIRPSETKLAFAPAAEPSTSVSEPVQAAPVQTQAAVTDWAVAEAGADILLPEHRRQVVSRLDEFAGFSLRPHQGNLLDDAEYAPEAQTVEDLGTSLNLLPPGTEVLADHERGLPVVSLIDVPDLQVASLGERLSDPQDAVPQAPDVTHIKLKDL